MCGLAGAYSDTALSASEIEAVRQLSILSCLRGTDSGGFFAYRTEAKRSVVYSKKTTNTLAHLMNSDKGAAAILNPTGNDRLRFVVAHARAATQGVINEHNAHPHSAKNKSLIGVHNGTIPAFSRKKDKDHSDSRELFDTIGEKGLLETVNLAGWDGAMAIVYYNYEEGTLNFYRNSLRPLWMATTTSKDTMFWASEKWMLELVASRSGTPAMTNFRELPTHTRISVNIRTGKFTEESGISKKEQQYVPSTPVSNPVGRPLSEEYRASLHARVEATRADRRAAATKTFEKGTFRGFRSCFSLEAIKSFFAKTPCSCCGGYVDEKDVVWWQSEKTFFCGDCVELNWLPDFVRMGSLVRGEMIND